MTEPLSRDDVAHVAKLARLRLTEDELVRYTEQLGKILVHAQDLSSLDLQGVAPTAHPFGLINVVRSDEVRASLDPAAVLDQAPDVEDGRFAVPRIVGEAP
jgi:aspartyl-tRNA(Asn)/glutamyl-tRNA(Gln) amidotransferase subunit C